ncbi:MAG: hypothetical protein DHS20C11_37420 [Lysobacteraceae bacterium]|nr:MAG: hypothetical protein DHS20C11_37420 [Xanthomonadaceae bacterium]
MMELSWWAWVLILGVGLPIVVLLVLAAVAYFFGRRWVSKFVDPDAEAMHQQLMRDRERSPNATAEELVAPVIRKQALKCGLVGAVTGLGGFVTLPIALPVDLLLTARYQTAMVSFIASAYGHESAVENKAATYAVLTGSTELTRLTSKLLQRYLPKVIGKSFSKLVPIVGAVISFAVNYAMAKAMARMAIRWYSREQRASGQPV